jgi:hypothetical protein
LFLAPRPGLEPGTYGLTVEDTLSLMARKWKILKMFSGGLRATSDRPNLCRTAMVEVSVSPPKTPAGSTSYEIFRRTGTERRYGELAGEGGWGENWPAGGPSGRGMGLGRGGRQSASKCPIWSRAGACRRMPCQRRGGAGWARHASLPQFVQDYVRVFSSMPDRSTHSPDGSGTMSTLRTT